MPGMRKVGLHYKRRRVRDTRRSYNYYRGMVPVVHRCWEWPNRDIGQTGDRTYDVFAVDEISTLVGALVSMLVKGVLK